MHHRRGQRKTVSSKFTNENFRRNQGTGKLIQQRDSSPAPVERLQVESEGDLCSQGSQSPQSSLISDRPVRNSQRPSHLEETVQSSGPQCRAGVLDHPSVAPSLYLA